MTRFGGRAIAAVAVWVGLAMLGYGPRASASFLPFATPVPQSNPGAEGGGAGSGPSELQKHPDSTLFSDALQALKTQDCGPQSPTGGGAGAPSTTTSSGPTGHAVMLVAGTDLTGSSLTTRLRWRESLPIPDPITAAIFEPPRAG